MRVTAAMKLGDLARIEAEQGRAREALGDISGALALVPRAPELLGARASVLQSLDDFVGTIEACRETAAAYRRVLEHRQAPAPTT